MSKWQDVAVHTGNYHMQQSHYDCIKPPNYYDNHDLNKFRLSRDREKADNIASGSRRYLKLTRKSRRLHSSIQSFHEEPIKSNASVTDEGGLSDDFEFLLGEGLLDGGWGSLFSDDSSTYHALSADPDAWANAKSEGFVSTHGGRTPSLFLQELVHLTSLCNAVAFSTLRNDVEGAQSTLDMYHPGSIFPKVDPGKLLR